MAAAAYQSGPTEDQNTKYWEMRKLIKKLDSYKGLANQILPTLFLISHLN